MLQPGQLGAAPDREVEQITQSIITVGDGRLRISKAEGHPPGAQDQLFRYFVQDGTLQLQPPLTLLRRLASHHGWRSRSGGDRAERPPSQGERLVQKELRRTLLKYRLHTDQELFDKAYEYIKQYY